MLAHPGTSVPFNFGVHHVRWRSHLRQLTGEVVDLVSAAVILVE